MKKLINYFWQHPIAERFPVLREMFKFGLVGLTNVAVDFSIYFFLTGISIFWQEYYLAANFVSFVIAVTWSFFINKYWTFKHQAKGAPRQYVKFFIVSFVGLLLAESILYLTVDVFKKTDVYGKVSAIFIVYFWNFFINKYWTFRKQEEEKGR